MEGMPGTTRLGLSGSVLQAEPAVSTEYPQFVVQDKPPPSYEESQQQQHLVFRTETSEVSQADKLAIYRHPLFPLLAMLFDKCEQATNSNEGPSSHAFQTDIRSFLLHLGQDGNVLISGNEETDSLMVKAILVLKIHLLEIEKVNELCKDFCQRYIACLKGKLQTDNMLRGIYTSGMDDFPCSIPTDPTVQLNQVQDISSLAYLSHSSPPTGDSSSLTLHGSTLKTFAEHIVPVTQSPRTQPTSVNSQVQEITGITTTANTSASLTTPCVDVVDSQYISPVSGAFSSSQSLVATAQSISSILPRKQSRRGVLPKQATNVMKAWLFQHIAHPYPSEEEKRVLSSQTNLTLLQVNNWFINARRRILQPMLDASNPEFIAKSRKSKTLQSRSAQRFWPESLVQTIQGTTSTIQFPTQTLHIISAADLKDGLQPIAVAPAGTVLPTTGIRIQSVHSDKLVPILATLSCPPQSMIQSDLQRTAVVNNDNVTTTKESIIAPSTTVVQVVSAETEGVVSNHDLPTVSELQITASQVSKTFT